MVREYEHKTLDFAVYSGTLLITRNVITNVYVSQLEDNQTTVVNTRLNFTEGNAELYSIEEFARFQPGNCASKLVATGKVLIVACPSTG